MKPTGNQTKRCGAFTIVELLTVMSIIVILIGLLVPALNQVKKYATNVRERAQLHSMDAAIELFNSEFEGYPPSNALDPTGQPYCGAMKLCEALMGQDLLGFHTNSVFRRDGLDTLGTTTNPLYPRVGAVSAALYDSNLKSRKGPFLQAENANAKFLSEIYGANNVAPFGPDTRVLCDVYAHNMKSSNKTGMPILYYKADTANSFHDPNLASQMSRANSAGNIYNYWDNYDLINLGKPWQAASTGGSSGGAAAHNLLDPIRFYKDTQSDQITTTHRPYRADQYILISAGWDGEYGTADDICNFDWRYKP